MVKKLKKEHPSPFLVGSRIFQYFLLLEVIQIDTCARGVKGFVEGNGFENIISNPE